VNDRPEDADRLAEIARAPAEQDQSHSLQPGPGLEWKRPERRAVEGFAHRLLPIAPAVTVRRTLGGEIWAACGQLGGLGS
jgi:adenine C2-methylase RlmN of 23S rRNA A2503 and tRNA A37